MTANQSSFEDLQKEIAGHIDAAVKNLDNAKQGCYDTKNRMLQNTAEEILNVIDNLYDLKTEVFAMLPDVND